MSEELQRAEMAELAVGTMLKNEVLMRDEINRLRTALRPSWECMGKPGECNWPDCGCDPHATKVIQSLIEQGWTPPRIEEARR